MGFKIKQPRDEAGRKKEEREGVREREEGRERGVCVYLCQGQRASSSQGHGGWQPMSLPMQCKSKAKDYQ